MSLELEWYKQEFYLCKVELAFFKIEFNSYIFIKHTDSLTHTLSLSLSLSHHHSSSFSLLWRPTQAMLSTKKIMLAIVTSFFVLTSNLVLTMLLKKNVMHTHVKYI